MKQKVKKKWIKALRGGEFTQGRGYLRDMAGRYCCLGVLTQLYCDAKGKEWSDVADRDDACLPFQVMEWSGLHSSDPAITLDGGLDGLYSLSDLNDSGTTGHPFSFKKIAKVIKKEF